MIDAMESVDRSKDSLSEWWRKDEEKRAAISTLTELDMSGNRSVSVLTSQMVETWWGLLAEKGEQFSLEADVDCRMSKSECLAAVQAVDFWHEERGELGVVRIFGEVGRRVVRFLRDVCRAGAVTAWTC